MGWILRFYYALGGNKSFDLFQMAWANWHAILNHWKCNCYTNPKKGLLVMLQFWAFMIHWYCFGLKASMLRIGSFRATCWDMHVHGWDEEGRKYLKWMAILLTRYSWLHIMPQNSLLINCSFRLSGPSQWQ